MHPRNTYTKANWQQYKNVLSEHPELELQQNTMTLADLDSATTLLLKQIKQSSKRTIPRTKHKTLPHPKTNHNIRTLQIEYNAIKQEIQTYGPNHNLHSRMLLLQYQLQKSYKEISESEWNNIIHKLAEDNNPKTFWHSMKKLQGNHTKTHANYIRDHHNNKLFKPRHKERIFRDHWQKTFTQEQDEVFDANTDIEVVNNLNTNKSRIIPFRYYNTNRANIT